MTEKYYTISEVSELLKMSLERVRQLFMKEPGVLLFKPESRNGKPSRRTMYRIPESVLQRILRRKANPASSK